MKQLCRKRLILKRVLFTGIVRQQEDGWLSSEMGG
jgi:hypothetical protein